MSENKQNDQSQGGKDAKKIKAAYALTFGKILAILGGEKNLIPKRTVGGDVLKGVLIKITEEDDEALAVKVKEKLRNIVTKHVEFKKEMLVAKAALDALELKKMEEFNQAGKELFDLINHNDEAFKDMLSSLGDLAKLAKDAEAAEKEGEGMATQD